MFPVMKYASKVNGLAFVLLMVVMLAYSLPRVVEFAEKEDQAVSLYLDGALSRKFEKSYDTQLFLRELSVEYWANLRYLLFSEGLEGVLIGDDDWLFSKEEYTFPNNMDERLQQRFAQIEQVRQTLANAGKRLIIVPVPMKNDIYAEFSPFDYGAQSQALYESFVRHLQQNNIATVPLRAAFMAAKSDGLLFLKKDTHWTPAGAELAAREVARVFPDLIGEVTYETHNGGDISVEGDLLNFVKVSDWLAGELKTPESVAGYETLKQTSTDDASGLFGENTVSTALVGTSYTAIDDWHFEGFLKQHLQRDLVTKSIKEKGPFVSMQQFLDSELLADADIQQVIWELPVRALIGVDQSRNAWQATMDDLF